MWKLSWHRNTCPILSENELQWLHFASLKGDTFGSFEWKPFTAGRKERQSSCLASHDACLSQPTDHIQTLATKDINLWLQITQLVPPHIQSTAAPYHPLLSFRNPLFPCLHGSDWRRVRYQVHIWAEEIIGFVQCVDGIVQSAKFGGQSLHVYHASDVAQLHTAGLLTKRRLDC